MNFWESGLGEITGKAEDAFTKSFDDRPIPNGTMALSAIESMVNAEFNGEKFISIKWVLSDGEFKGRSVVQKIRVFDNDEKKRHKALNMLKLMYQLFSIKPAHGNAPSDSDLAVFTGKSAGLCINETKPNDDGRKYNWVSEVRSSNNFKSVTGKELIVESRPSIESAFSRASSKEMVLDDLPF